MPRNNYWLIFLHINEHMDTLRLFLSILGKGKLAITQCNNTSQTSPLLEKAFHTGNLIKTAHNLSRKDLNCVRSAFLIEQMPLKYGKFLRE